MADKKPRKRSRPQSKKKRPQQPSSPISVKTQAEITHFPAQPAGAQPAPRVADFRRAVEGTSWNVHESLSDTDPVPRHPLGGSPEHLTPADPAKRLDWKELLRVPPVNPAVLEDASEMGLLPEGVVPPPPAAKPGRRAKKGDGRRKRR